MRCGTQQVQNKVVHALWQMWSVMILHAYINAGQVSPCVLAELGLLVPLLRASMC